MYRMKPFFLFLPGIILFQPGFAQNVNTTISANSAPVTAYDTNYIAKYLSKLVIGIAQSEKHFEVDMLDTFAGFKNVFFQANSAHSIGLSIDYDIIGIGFDVYSYPVKTDPLGGKTRYSSFSINFNLRKFRSENSIKYYR